MKNKLYITRNKTNRYLKNFTSTLLIILTLSCIPQIGFSKSSGDPKVRMSFDQSGVTIKEVLTSIESKSEYVFFYSDEIKNDLNKRVNIHVNSKTVSEILSNLLNDTQLSFRFNENQVTIARNQKINADNYIRINGTIKDKIAMIFSLILPFSKSTPRLACAFIIRCVSSINVGIKRNAILIIIAIM